MNNYKAVPKEEWKDIDGYEGLYMVSSYGRIKSIPRKGTKGCIIRPSFSGSGYLQTHLCKNKISRTFQVHRLVAVHFISNPKCLPEVNHKDEVKTNNCVWNLEFCTRAYNENYGTKIERSVKHHNYKESSIKSALHHNYKEVGRKLSKPVLQMAEDWNVIKKWESLQEVSRTLNYSCGNISMVCNGKKEKAYGFRWMFEANYK